MPTEGLEPSSHEAPPSEDGVFANFTTLTYHVIRSFLPLVGLTELMKTKVLTTPSSLSG